VIQRPLLVEAPYMWETHKSDKQKTQKVHHCERRSSHLFPFFFVPCGLRETPAEFSIRDVPSARQRVPQQGHQHRERGRQRAHRHRSYKKAHRLSPPLQNKGESTKGATPKTATSAKMAKGESKLLVPTAVSPRPLSVKAWHARTHIAAPLLAKPIHNAHTHTRTSPTLITFS
jgi:hypothetical protein